MGVASEQPAFRLAVLLQDVAQPRPDELPPVLGQPQGLRHCLWLCPGMPSSCQIHFPHQRDWQPLPGPGDPTMSFRIYKSVLAAVNKTQEGHPFKQFLDIDVTLPADKVTEITDGLFTKLNSILAKLKSVLLVENVIESLKFAVAMYLLTYIGAIMNGLTIVTLVWVGYFSIPRIYRDNQKQIDEAILPLKSKLEDLQSKLQAALPASIVGKKEE